MLFLLEHQPKRRKSKRCKPGDTRAKCRRYPWGYGSIGFRGGRVGGPPANGGNGNGGNGGNGGGNGGGMGMGGMGGGGGD